MATIESTSLKISQAGIANLPLKLGFLLGSIKILFFFKNGLSYGKISKAGFHLRESGLFAGVATSTIDQIG